LSLFFYYPLIIIAETWEQVKKIALIILELAENWCKTAFMTYEKSKCWILCLNMGKSKRRDLETLFEEVGVKFLYNCRFLGVIIDTNLNFVEHLKYLKTAWNWKIYILRKIVRTGIYFSKALTILFSFRTRLTFGLWWWENLSLSNIEELEGMWRKAVRVIAKFPPKSSTKTLFQTMQIETLQTTVENFMAFWRIKVDYSITNNNDEQKNTETKVLHQKRYNLRSSTVHKITETNISSNKQRKIFENSTKILNNLRTAWEKNPGADPKRLLDKLRYLGNKEIRKDSKVLIYLRDVAEKDASKYRDKL